MGPVPGQNHAEASARLQRIQKLNDLDSPPSSEKADGTLPGSTSTSSPNPEPEESAVSDSQIDPQLRALSILQKRPSSSNLQQDDNLPAPSKRYKREKVSAGKEVASAIKALTETAQSLARANSETKSERAVRHLREKFRKMLTMRELLFIIGILKNEREAAVYLQLDDELQRAWIENELEKLHP